MSFDVAKYRAACTKYAAVWKPLDDVLYDLCKNHPAHAARGSINAKLWIIGRTYATGIERKIESKGSQGSSMTQLADHFETNKNTIDQIVSQLGGFTEPLTEKMLETIVGVHGQLFKLIQPLLTDQQSPRSFVSKYLHFHCPLVPVYDNIAQQELRKLVRWRKKYEVFALPPGADRDYARYCFRFWQLYQEINQTSRAASVKLVDNYLLSLA
jgi:hypothetical protein